MIKLLCCALALLLSSTTVSALTIDQAVKDALQQNPRIQQVLALSAAAESKADKALAPFWPRLDAGYSYWREEQDPALSSRNLSQIETRASYNLFNGGSDWHRRDQAQQLAATAGYQQRSVIADTVLDVKQAYIEVLRAERTVETEQKSVELLQQQQRNTRLRHEQGLLARNELLRVDVEMATAKQILAQAEGRLQVARQTLAQTLGRALSTDEEITDFTLESAPLETEAALREEMFQSRSELKFLRSQLAADQAGYKAVRGDYLPDLDLHLSYNRFGNDSLPETGDADYDSESKAMLQANWTLFSGFDTRYELASRGHEMRARHHEIKATEDRLTLQLQTALEAFHVSERNLVTAETSVLQAEENYRVNENRYQANVASTVDLLDAQEFLTRARNERVKAQYDLYRSAAVIERVLERGPTLAE